VHAEQNQDFKVSLKDCMSESHWNKYRVTKYEVDERNNFPLKLSRLYDSQQWNDSGRTATAYFKLRAKKKKSG
jgi:hypothetical protein